MKKRYLVAVALAGGVGALVLWAKKDEPAERGVAAMAATLVRVQPVSYTDQAVPVQATGVLARKAEAEFSFKIGGVVETVAVRVGDRVTRGQVLARLEPQEIEAQVAQARSAADKAERDVARLEKLTASGVATVENLQDARTAREVASAALKAAEFNQRHARIVAPADGRILRRLAEPGELVAVGRPVLGFAADDEGWIVRVGLADRDAAQVRLGDRVDVRVGGENGENYAGRVTQMAEGTDPVTRTTPVEIALEIAPSRTRSGAVVSVEITPQAGPSRPVVAASALVEGAGRSAHVFIVDEGATVARRVAVDVETLWQDRVYLRTKLPRTARVVVVGAEYLREGMPVEIAR
jgi:RND family efflux transporter MFP subunit